MYNKGSFAELSLHAANKGTASDPIERLEGASYCIMLYYTSKMKYKSPEVIVLVPLCLEENLKLNKFYPKSVFSMVF
jgi:hypothetical protein